MKKNIFLSLLLVALSSISLVAHDFEVDGIYYKINDDGVSVSVTYKGSSYSSGSNTYSGHVTIPAEVSYNEVTYHVTAIAGDAFRGCKGLTNIDLPNTITQIGRYSFHGCDALTNVEIPNSVTFIGIGAFMNCSSLSELFVPASVELIETSAYSGCVGLTSIEVDENNRYYDSREHCNAIIGKERNELIAACINTVIPNTVKRLGEDAFSGFTWLTEVNLPDALEYIGICAFEGCSGLTSIMIPNTVTEIDGHAFMGCTGLTEITLPESLEILGGSVFYGCSGLTSLHIPANVIRIGYSLVSHTNVTSITVDPANKIYDSRDNCNAIIETRTGTLIVGCNNSTVPNGVRIIDGVAFMDCDQIVNIELPSSLFAIYNAAFYNCPSLKSIIVPEGVEYIGMEAFRDCTSLTSVILPSTLQKEGIDNLGTFCFYGCYNLKDVTCFALTPPVIGPFARGAFDPSTYQNATLHVPFEALARYKVASDWHNFKNIMAIGDINGDGKLGINDVSELIGQLMADGEQPAYCDVNGDGQVTIVDVTALIDMLLNVE